MDNMKDLISAYFYGRVSTDGQDRALSVGEQKGNSKTLAEREGLNIIRDFAEVQSAATDKRPVFEEMRSLLLTPNHPVKTVIFNDLSRAFRDDEDFYINRRIFREAGVEIFTYEEGHLTEDDDSQLRFGFKSLMNSQVPRKTARETRRGQFGATRLGFYIGPDVFGYEKCKVVYGEGEHTKLQPHPDQFDHLLTMKRMALENHTGESIAKHMKDLGVKTVKGKDFTGQAVICLLRNPVLRGHTHRGERSTSRYLDKSERAVNKNAHKPAMSQEEYETIEELILVRATNPGGPRAQSSPSLLSRHVHCGLCGAPMNMSTSDGIPRLICSNKKKYKACRGKNVRLDILLTRVVAALVNQIATEKNLRQQVTMVAESHKEILEEKQANRKTIQKNKESKEKQISNLIDTIENRGGNPQLYQRLDTRENELKQLIAQLEGLDELFHDQLQFLNAPEKIIAHALDLRTYIESEDPEIARTFILSFIKNVVVLGNEATIHYGIPMPRDPTGNPNPTERVSLNKNNKSCLSDMRTGARKGLWISAAARMTDGLSKATHQDKSGLFS